MRLSASRNPSDAALYEGLRNNDAASFEHLYNRCYPLVRQQVRQYGGTDEEARDLFQDGVVALWKNIRSGRYALQPDTRLSTYLVEICRRQWINTMKKASRRRETHPETLPEVGQEPDILAAWEDRAAQAQFEAVFSRLSPRCQQILRHFYFDKMNLRQIAETLGIAEGSAKNEKYRCMQRLRKLYLSPQP